MRSTNSYYAIFRHDVYFVLVLKNTIENQKYNFLTKIFNCVILNRNQFSNLEKVQFTFKIL